MEVITAKTPWEGHTEDVPMHLDYFEGTMYDKVEQIAEEYPYNVALDFMGSKITYRSLIDNINNCAKALKTIGIRPGDRITIAMPNCPQAITCSMPSTWWAASPT